MRVLQTSITTDAVTRSDDPARSVKALVGVAERIALIDDQHVVTEINPFEVKTISKATSMIFYAKDSQTLIRGFHKVFERKQKSKDFTLVSGDNIAGLSLEWSGGDTRHTSSVVAGLLSVKSNVGTAIRRGGIYAGIGVTQRRGSTEGGIFTGDGDLKTKSTMVKQVRGVVGGELNYQNVKHNMEMAGRDGSLVQRGVALFLCPAGSMPNDLKWGRTYRHMGSQVDCSMLTRIATTLFKN